MRWHKRIFEESNNLNFILAYFCAVFPPIALIALIIYLHKKQYRKARQAFFLPIIAWPSFYLLKNIDDGDIVIGLAWPDPIHFPAWVAILLLLSIPVVAIFIVRLSSRQYIYIHSQAFDEGKIAFSNDVNIEENPYQTTNSGFALEWERGWKDNYELRNRLEGKPGR